MTIGNAKATALFVEKGRRPPTSAAFPAETEVMSGALLSERFGLPSINIENGSLAITGPVRRQESHHRGNFRRLAKTPYAELFGHS
jgi:hypothetical protein